MVFGAAQPDGGEMDVYRIEISSGAVVNLTAGSSVWDAFPQWSPAGNQIVFVSDRHADGKLLDNLWLMDENGGSLQQLTFTDTWEESFPSWSPDGSRIAFFRWGIFGDESEGKPGLIVIDIASGTETVITEDANLTNRSLPVWSPNGEYLAYLDNALTDEGNILVVPAKGVEPLKITDLPGENYGISWSPDSEWIMFTHQADNEWRLYLVHRDGTGLRPLFDFDGNAFGEWFQTNRD